MLFSTPLSPFYPLATERLILRPWTYEDLEALVPLANDSRISKRLCRMPFPYTPDTAREFISFAQHSLSEEQSLHLAIVRRTDQTLLGGIGYDQELGYWIGHAFWGEGYGKEAVSTFVRYLFSIQYQKDIYANSLENNTVSRHILENIGFVETGKKQSTSLAYEGTQPGVTYALSEDDFIKRDRTPPKPIVWASAAFLLNEKRQVLLTERLPGKTLAGAWEPPGGKLEGGETPEEALIRELKEEVDLSVHATDLRPLTFLSYPYEAYHLVLTCYLCHHWQGLPKGAEGQNIAWVTFDELTSLSFPPPSVILLRKIEHLLKEKGDSHE